MTEKAMKTNNNSNPLFNAIFTHPLAIVTATLWLFLIMPTGFLFLFPLGLGNDPERGFETDGTPFSGQRLAWTLLQPALVQGSLANFAPADSARRRDKRSWADDLVLSFGSVACYDEPIPAMSFLSQFLVTIPGREELFSRDFLLQMCQLQQELALELSTFAPFTPYRTVWSLPNYVGCLGPNSRANCSFLTDEDIHAFRSAFDHCLLHRHNILACRRSCQPSSNFESAESQQPCPDKVNNKACEKVPNKCDGQMWFDLFYRILPADLSLRPLPLNSFLPFYSFSAYRLQGINIGLKAFSDFEAKIVALADESQVFELKGLSLDTKRDLLLEAAVRDSRFSLLAAMAIFLLLLLYSLSLAFALAVLLQLFAAVLSSLAIFRLFLTELPLLNTVAFVLLISVGSDGAFLLLDIFPAAEKLTQTSLNRALAHTCKTMFLTQFSTVVPFLLNLLSNVFAFRSFGLFAGLTLVFNYLLLISFLPAFLVAQKRYLNPCLVRLWPSRCWYCFSGSSSALSLDSLPNATPLGANIAANLPARVPSTRLDRSRHFIRTLLDEVLPAVLIQGRFVWLGSLLVFLAVSAYLTLTQLSLPRYNPLQLFRSQNPHEYFEQNAEQLFPFVADKIAGLPFTIRLVWGIRPGRVLSHFDPKSAETPLRPDPHFVLNSTAQLQALAHQLEQIRTLPFVSHPSKFWPEKFIDWIASLPCSSAPQSPCCRIEESSNELDRCIRLSTTFIPTGYNDTLVWNNQTHQLVGYTALLPTRLPYSHRFHNLSASFALLDKFLPSDKTMPAGWYTTEWTVISQWFDLQLGIISDCKQSFIVSFAVVFIFSAMMLRMKAIYATITIFCIVLCTIGTLVFFGWEIGVLEGVILVLVVGLSFDYTLHIGALIPRHGCPEHQIQRAIRGAIRPVGMSGLSSILAGSVMLQAETHAFYQVSVFLVVCSSLSLIFAIFFFPPILYVMTTASQSLHCQSIARTECEWCQQKNFKMKRLKKRSEGTI